MNRILSFLFLLAMLTSHSYAQVKIGDNPTTVNPNSILELESTTKGLLLPRISNTQMQAMQNVPAGMLVYSSTDNVLYIRTNSAWITLAQAANAASVTNPWSTTGGAVYTTAGKVGIGTNAPSSQLANTALNTIGSDGFGGNSSSLAWAAAQQGYAAQIYNGQPGYGGNGLAVKVASPGGTALDVSTGAQDAKGTSLLYVNSNGRVGINTNGPAEALDVKGNITTSGSINATSSITTSGSVSATTFNLGVQYVYLDYTATGTGAYSVHSISCPNGTQLIGGGAGARDDNSAIEDIRLAYSGPDSSNPNGTWLVRLVNSSYSDRAIRMYAICAKVK